MTLAAFRRRVKSNTSRQQPAGLITEILLSLPYTVQPQNVHRTFYSLDSYVHVLTAKSTKLSLKRESFAKIVKLSHVCNAFRNNRISITEILLGLPYTAQTQNVHRTFYSLSLQSFVKIANSSHLSQQRESSVLIPNSSQLSQHGTQLCPAPNLGVTFRKEVNIGTAENYRFFDLSKTADGLYSVNKSFSRSLYEESFNWIPRNIVCGERFCA
jgi:hypothetical protein